MQIVEHRALARRDIGANLLHETLARERLRVLGEKRLAFPDLLIEIEATAVA